MKKKVGDGEVVTLIDTGSADNIISSVAHEQYGFLSPKQDEIFDLTGVGGTVYAQKGEVEFGVMGFISET